MITFMKQNLGTLRSRFCNRRCFRFLIVFYRLVTSETNMTDEVKKPKEPTKHSAESAPSTQSEKPFLPKMWTIDQKEEPADVELVFTSEQTEHMIPVHSHVLEAHSKYFASFLRML